MLTDLFILAASLYVIIKAATLSTRYAIRLATDYRLSEYLVGFIIVAVISILPEAFISINAAVSGIPAFGLGTLFGSNVADLTLVFAVIIAFTKKGIKVESKILRNNIVYPFLLLIPLVLGLDGYYSRWEGSALIMIGAIFYLFAFKNGHGDRLDEKDHRDRLKNFSLLILAMAALLVGAHFTVTSATSLAQDLNVTPILIGMFIVGLGTTMPELLFSLKSVNKHDNALAIGDILGTVLADATIVVGILALVSPFAFPTRVIYLTGLFMVTAAFILFYFMRTGRRLTKREGVLLVMFWIVFVLAELMANS